MADPPLFCAPVSRRLLCLLLLLATPAIGQWNSGSNWVAGEAAAALAEAVESPRRNSRHLEDTSGKVDDVMDFKDTKEIVDNLKDNIKGHVDNFKDKVTSAFNFSSKDKHGKPAPFKNMQNMFKKKGGHEDELSFQMPTLLPPGHDSLHSTTQNLQRSPVVRFAKAVDTWLHDPAAPQFYIGVAAIVVGTCLLFCFGPMAWQYIFSFAMALCTALFVSYQDETLKLAPGAIGNGVLILQVAIIMGVATFLGFEGSQMLLGCVVGLLSAYFTDPLAASWEKEFPWLSFAWLCAGAANGGIVFTAFRQLSLATLAPLIGGFLVISGSGALFTWLGINIILEEHTTWIDAAIALLGHTGGAGMVGQSVMALISAVVFSWTGDPKMSILPMAIGLGLGALASAIGLGCSIHKFYCTPFVQPPRIWAWPLVGGLGWMGTAAGGAVWQLTQIAEERKSPKSRRKDSKNRRSDRAEETNPLLHTQPQLQRDQRTQPQLHLPNSSATYNDGYNAGRAAMY